MRIHDRRQRAHGATELAVECWCRAEVVYVDQKDVMAVRTKSCGLSKCKPPEEKS